MMNPLRLAQSTVPVDPYIEMMGQGQPWANRMSAGVPQDRGPMGPPQYPAEQQPAAPMGGGGGGQQNQFLSILQSAMADMNRPRQNPMQEYENPELDEIREMLMRSYDTGQEKGMTPAQKKKRRKQFLLEMGMRGLAASGQPGASFASAIGGAGVQTMESQQERDRYEQQQQQQQQLMQRQQAMDLLGVNRARGQDMERHERRGEREEDRDMRRLDTTARMAQAADQIARPQHQILSTGEGYAAVDPRSPGSPAVPIQGAEGPLARAPQEREFEIDRRFQYAARMYPDDEQRALEIALRASEGMSPEEKYARWEKFAWDIVGRDVRLTGADHEEKADVVSKMIRRMSNEEAQFLGRD